MARGAVEQAGGVLHRAADENGVDPRPNPHDTAHMGRALHGSGGAVPVVASKQTGPAPHRSQRPECTPAAPLVRSAEPPPPASQNRNRDARPRWISSPPPPDSWRSAAAGYLPTAAPSQLPPANHAATAPRCPMSLKSPSKRGFSSPPTCGRTRSGAGAKQSRQPVRKRGRRAKELRRGGYVVYQGRGAGSCACSIQSGSHVFEWRRRAQGQDQSVYVL